MNFARNTILVAALMAAGSAAQADPGLTTLATFSEANGATPYCTLIRDTAGNLYGTTAWGGLYNEGTVFELPIGGSSVTTLVTFNTYNGGSPVAGLIADKAGNLYGTTSMSIDGPGTVFKVPAGGGSVTTLGFITGADFSSLTADAAGNLYCTAFNGGANTCGAVLKVVPGNSTLTLTTFNTSNGAYPRGNLIIDAAGNLFGTATQGGPGGNGTVFKVNSGSGVLTTLAGFDGVSGTHPYGNLVADSAGNFYGTTNRGGLYDDGTVFKLPAGSSAIIPLASFNGLNGADSVSGLIIDAAGNLFGTTSSGGIGDGNVFEVPAGGGSIITLATFDSTNGSNPDGSLVADADGNLYGTTATGGADGAGTIFELTDTGFVTAAPEPASFSLLGIAGFALLRRGTRRGRGISF